MELMKSNEEAKNSFTKLVKLENGESCENNNLKVLQVCFSLIISSLLHK